MIFRTPVHDVLRTLWSLLHMSRSPVDGRVDVYATAAASKYRYGLEFGPASTTMVASLTLAVKRAVWRRSPWPPLEECLFTLPFKGWKVHPRMIWITESLACFQRLMLRYPGLRDPFVKAWAAVRDDKSSLLPTRFGIVANLLRVGKAVGWTWPEPFGHVH